tara:strand:+ start:262 stop:462 length:201 start_codon:yes stop_codon:yes gene_type:complete
MKTKTKPESLQRGLDVYLDTPHYSSDNSDAGCGGCLIILGMMFVFFLVVARNIMEGIAPGSTSWPW